MTRALRKHLAEKGIGSSRFRWRGGEVTRLEGFTDAVFAFAITLLVVSLEVPRTFSELAETMRGFLAFGICFALLFQVWYTQYLFFRRYGLEDTFVVVMNALLLFVVLFYVYPLKFLFTILVDEVLGIPTGIRHPDGRFEQAIEPGQVPSLMLIFGAGYIAVSLIFLLLYRYADRRREELELNGREVLDTRESIAVAGVNTAVAATSMLLAALGRGSLAGWVYLLNGPLHAVRGMYFGKRRRMFEEEGAATPAR